MKNIVKILVLLVTHSSVLKCLPMKEEHGKNEPHTEILNSVPNGSLENQAKPCSQEVSNNLNQEQGNMKHKIMFKTPAKMYVNNLRYGNQYMVAMPQSAMEYLTAFNRNVYQNAYVRSLPALETLPSVFVSRRRNVENYYDEPYYDPHSLKQNTVFIPVYFSPERSTSEEEFWAQLSQDSTMNNVIPTMDIPLSRDPYEQYELVRPPYPLSPQELMTNNGVVAYYPESELRAYEKPLLYRYRPDISRESDISEDYPHTEIRTG